MGYFEAKAEELNGKVSKVADSILSELNIADGEAIADIGSGGGYLTYEFAKRVGNDGKVFAIDVEQGFLDCISAEIEKRNIQNIFPILSVGEGFILPKQCDLFFMRNVFHHIGNPVGYFSEIKKYLKDDGEFIVTEWLPDANISMHGHWTEETAIIDAFTQAGYEPIRSSKAIEGASFNVFKKSGNRYP